MKKIIAMLLLTIMMVILCACGNYTETLTRGDCVIVNYYTSTGELYQVVEFNKQTNVTIITTYYWTYDSNGRQILTKIELNRINGQGELVP